MKDLTTDNIHGTLGESPNQLYKNYVIWFRKTYDSSKKPLTFKAWLAWAKDKKVVLSADGDEKPSPIQTLELKIREIQMPYVLIGAALGAGISHLIKHRDKMGWFIAGGAIAGAVVSLMIPKIKVQSTSGDEKGGGSGGGGGSSSTSGTMASPLVVVTSTPRKIIKAASIPKTSSTSGSANFIPQQIQTATSPSTPPIGSGNGGSIIGNNTPIVSSSVKITP